MDILALEFIFIAADPQHFFSELRFFLLSLQGQRKELSYASENIPLIYAVHMILKYLNRSPGQGILHSVNRYLMVKAYIDADWTGSKTDRRSITNYRTLVGGNLVSRKRLKTACNFQIQFGNRISSNDAWNM